MNISSQVPKEEKPLPLLRGDIKIFRGPDDPDGSPTYNCLDPVTAQYFKITWQEFTILQHLRAGMTMTQLAKELSSQTTIKTDPEELKSFFEDAQKNGLLAIPKQSDAILEDLKKRKTNPIVWVLFHYLYFRIPILNPDKFLARTLKYVRPLVSKPAIYIYVTLTFIGLFFLVDRLGEFFSTFTYFFNLEGLITYALTISCVKVIHEFSHAYTAKYYRLHVPTMGIALIVLWPVLYTDVTDGWKLKKRSQRLAISFAGVASELILAGLATFGWVLSKPGFFQSIFFIVSSATWISTLLVNLNPAMRFDGYYLMTDLMGIDNLQARGFAFTRWQLRKWLLGLDVPPPEEGLEAKRKIFMMVYSIYTWIYRIVLYTVIAIFVYFEFTKALGIILFLVEIFFFILPPFFSEAKQLYRLSPFMTWNKRSIITTTIASIFAFWFIVPLPHMEKFPAITIPAENQTLYITQEGKIEAIHAKRGDEVKPHSILLQLSAPSLEMEIKATQAEIESLKAQIHVLSIKEEDRSYIPEKTAELASAESKLKTLQEKLSHLSIQSTIHGTIYEWDDTLLPNRFLEKNQTIGRIAPLNHIQVFSYIPEVYIHDIQLGQRVNYRLKSSLEFFKGMVIEISPVRDTVLYYPALASINHGELPVNQDKEGKLLLIESYYQVRIELDTQDDKLQIGERGQLYVRGPWRSLLMDLIRYVHSIYLRESGL